MSVQEMTEQLIDQIITTKSNEEFIERMKYFFKNNKQDIFSKYID